MPRPRLFWPAARESLWARRRAHPPPTPPFQGGEFWVDTPAHHFCAMVIDALGNWALIEGEYIASTRVDGMLNVPAPLSRIR